VNLRWFYISIIFNSLRSLLIRSIMQNSQDHSVDHAMNAENEVENRALVRTLPRMKNLSKVSDAVLTFENVKFIAGKGNKQKVILHGVSTTITSGREFSYRLDIYCLSFLPGN
jgi:hypothetical protein